MNCSRCGTSFGVDFDNSDWASSEVGGADMLCILCVQNIPLPKSKPTFDVEYQDAYTWLKRNHDMQIERERKKGKIK